MLRIQPYVNPDCYPSVEECLNRSKALAMADAILSLHDRENGYYSFEQNWRPGQHIAFMWDGSGDDYSALFIGDGVIYRALEHENGLTRKAWIAAERELLDLVPDVYKDFYAIRGMPSERAGTITETGWFDLSQNKWVIPRPITNHSFPSDSPLKLLFSDRPAIDVTCWAISYYEEDVPLSAVRRIFALEPLTQELVSSIRNYDLNDLRLDAEKIGYPVAKSGSAQQG